ncbi:GTPase family protein [Roseateles sp. DC23W]|uniref:GTPase family protein n=1 Tax=Pelomonas dachongensis TaxID=3299029 RepID=A0ABW7EPW7_9BURK
MNKSKIKQALTKDLFETFRKNQISDEMIQNLEEKISELGAFVPIVGIFGKTGVGKSSLCNALFGKDTAKVDDVNACTREPQEIFVKISESGSGIKLIDLPGVGEDKLRDSEYSELYRQWVPKLDLVIWVIRADDRTFSVDEFFYENIVKQHVDPAKTPFLVVINQVDKINPIREWDESNRRPGHSQMKIIGERTQWAAGKFAIPSDQIVALSAFEKYNMGALVEAIIDIVPNEKKLGFLNQMDEQVVTEKSRISVVEGIVNYVKEIYAEIRPYIPEIVAAVKWLVKWWRS